MEYLKSVNVEELPKVDTIHHVLANDSASAALKLLTKYNILSAPVLDKERNQYIGFVDMVDLAAFIVDIYTEADIMGENFFSLLEQGERFVTTKVKDIINISSRNPFVPVREGSSLFSVVELLAKHKVHRVPVIDHQGRVSNLITQSSIISFLSTHLDKLGDITNQTVGSLLLGHKDVITVGVNARAIDAFKLMTDRGVSAVGVVDEEGKLIGNISVRDIRVIATDARLIQRLYLGVREFIYKINAERIDIINPAIACSARDTYGLVVQRLAASRVHRIYVVDSHLPVGVISLSDALLPLVSSH
jgi:CBS-domain-containing membrane protein